jgi:hypothetical protein
MRVVLELGLNADVKRGIDYYVENVVNARAEVDERNQYCCSRISSASTLASSRALPMN